MNANSHKAGFSLLEVMCAILILGVGLVGLTQGIGAALRSSKESEIQTAAALMAAGQIELLRADGFVTDGDTDGEGDGAMSAYRWRQSVSSTDIEGLHDVVVTVENASSGQEIYELRTLLFDPPLTSSTQETDSDRRKKDRGRK